MENEIGFGWKYKWHSKPVRSGREIVVLYNETLVLMVGVVDFIAVIHFGSRMNLIFSMKVDRCIVLWSTPKMLGDANFVWKKSTSERAIINELDETMCVCLGLGLELYNILMLIVICIQTKTRHGQPVSLACLFASVVCLPCCCPCSSVFLRVCLSVRPCLCVCVGRTRTTYVCVFLCSIAFRQNLQTQKPYNNNKKWTKNA